MKTLVSATYFDPHHPGWHLKAAQNGRIASTAGKELKLYQDNRQVPFIKNEYTNGNAL